MRLSEQEFKQFCKAAGIQDPAVTADDEQRRKEIDMKIKLAIWAVEDKHWLQEHKEKLKAEKLKQREAARAARTTTRRSPAARPIPFYYPGPAKPMRFNSDKPFMVPAGLNGLAKNCMKNFKF